MKARKFELVPAIGVLVVDVIQSANHTLSDEVMVAVNVPVSPPPANMPEVKLRPAPELPATPVSYCSVIDVSAELACADICVAVDTSVAPKYRSKLSVISDEPSAIAGQLVDAGVFVPLLNKL